MLKYTDVYVATMARGLSQPGEQVVVAAAGEYQSFWTFKIPFFKYAYLLIATTDRLLVLQHRKGLVFDRLDRVDSYPWSQISLLKISGLGTKKLVVKDGQGRAVLKMKVAGSFLGPMKNSGTSARMIVQTWEQRRQLGPAAAHGALPQRTMGSTGPATQFT